MTLYKTASELSFFLSKVNKKIQRLEQVLTFIQEDFSVNFDEDETGSVLEWNRPLKKIVYAGRGMYTGLLDCNTDIRLKSLPALERLADEAEVKMRKMMEKQ